MLNRVNKLFIGKSVTGDGTILYGASHDFDAGELAVLDKNKKLLAAGSTIADSDTIYIAETLSETYSYVTESTGTSVTGVNKIITSDPIVGSQVKVYSGKSYTASTAEVWTVTPSLTPAVGTEYVLRIVYTDTREKPGQVTETYRYVATDTTVATMCAYFVAKINANKYRRVTASGGTTTIVLTGRTMPYDVTDSTDAIDEYYMVNFKVFLPSNNWGSATTNVHTTSAKRGIGLWQMVRDREKRANSYRGITNLTQFPVIKPSSRVDSTATYDIITIEHDIPVNTPDNQYQKFTKCTTEIALVVDAAQASTLLGILNPWMASCPGAFANISV